MFGKLPHTYTEHPTYLRLFAGSVRPFLTSAVFFLRSIYRVFSKLARLLCSEWSIKPGDQWLAGWYEHTLWNNAMMTL
jgi:hypothetical protein